MRTYKLQREQWVAKELERVFPFFARPENLALITPPGLGFRLLTPRPVDMQAGRVIDYTIRVSGWPVRWRTLITRYDPPWCFVDEQIAGPYSFWHHTHTFREQDGGTLIRDEVRYALPLVMAGPVRGLVHALYIRPKLERIFDFRGQVFNRLFDGSQQTVATATSALSPTGEGA